MIAGRCCCSWSTGGHRHQPASTISGRPGPAARPRHHARHRRADRRADPVRCAGSASGGGRGSTSGGPRWPRSAGWPARCSATSLTTQVSFLVVQNVANAASTRPGASYDSFSDLQLRLAAVPAAVRDRRHLGDHRAAAADERARRRAPLRAGPGRLLHRGPAVVGHRGAGRAAARRARRRRWPSSLFGYGSTTVAEARYIGEVFAVFSLGLVPYMMFQLLLRVFYALHDSRTPMFIGVAGHGGQHRAQPAGADRAARRPRGGRPGRRRSGWRTWWARWRPGASSAAASAGWTGSRSRISLVRMHAGRHSRPCSSRWAVTFMVGVIIAPGPVVRAGHRGPRRQRRRCCSTCCSPGRSGSARWPR